MKKIVTLILIFLCVLMLSSCSSTKVDDLEKQVQSLTSQLSKANTDLIQVQLQLKAAQDQLDEINAAGPQRINAKCSVIETNHTKCMFLSTSTSLHFNKTVPDYIKVVDLLDLDEDGASVLNGRIGLMYQSSTELEMIVVFSVLPKSTVETSLLVLVKEISSTQSLFATIDLDTQLSEEGRTRRQSFLNDHYGVSGALDADWDFRN